LDHLIFGFSVALSLQNLLYCFIGVFVGTLVGVLPGISPLISISMLLPITFALPPLSSLIMLAGIYYGAQYGGSTTSILLNLPGEASSVITCMDGYQMARQGRAGPALAVAAIASFFAGCVGTLLIGMFGPPIAELALKFHAAEYFSLMMMGLVAAAVLAQGDIVKALAMVMLGILLGVIGTDVNSGKQRFTFGLYDLSDGISFTIVAVGLFAIAEVIKNLEHTEETEVFTAKVTRLMPTFADMKASVNPTLRGTALGSFFGMLPGAGPAISAFSAYMFEKRMAKDPSRFGRGAIEGVASPEAANNAHVQCSFIPTLTLGIPGSPVMALMLGALMIQGIAPGPQVMTRNPELFWGLIASMWVGNLLLVVLNLPLVGIWVKLLKVPYRWLFPCIIMVICIGNYSLNNSSIEVYLTAAFGILGYVFLKLECEPAPLILGFVLGPLMEYNLRRAMLLSRGDPTVFFIRPISLAFILITVLLLAVAVMHGLRKQREKGLATAQVI
jgi:TctA family transporter